MLRLARGGEWRGGGGGESTLTRDTSSAERRLCVCVGLERVAAGWDHQRAHNERRQRRGTPCKQREVRWWWWCLLNTRVVSCLLLLLPLPPSALSYDDGSARRKRRRSDGDDEGKGLATGAACRSRASGRARTPPSRTASRRRPREPPRGKERRLHRPGRARGS